MQYASYFQKGRWRRASVLPALLPAPFHLLNDLCHDAHGRGETHKKQKVCKRNTPGLKHLVPNHSLARHNHPQLQLERGKVKVLHDSASVPELQQPEPGPGSLTTFPDP